MRLVRRVFEEDLDAQDAVWTQVVGDVVDVDVLGQDELATQFAARHLGAAHAHLRLVLRRHLQHLAVHAHLSTAPTTLDHLLTAAAFMH